MKKLIKRGLALVMSISLLSSLAFAAEANVLKCGTPEHTHSSACYAESAVLTCGLEEKAPEVVEVDTTETVVDEETGEEVTVVTTGTEVIPGHTHTAACYEEQSELVCGFEEHTHTDACYGENREIGEDENGDITVTPPAKFEAEAEDKTTAEVTVDENGNATVIVNGEKVDATVKTEVTSEPVNTTVTETNKVEETSRIENEDGSITIETTYTTTYTKEVTTGYWVTYTVTYTVPVTYSIGSNNNDNVVVGVDEKGNVTVIGINDGLTLEGNDGVEYAVTAKDGKYYVTIGGTAYEVKATPEKNEDGTWLVSWNFADENAKPSYTETTKVDVAKDKDLVDAMTVNEDGTVTLSKDVTINGTQFVVKEDGTIRIVDGGKEYEVALTATQNADGSYNLSWSYTAIIKEGSTTEVPGTQEPAPLPEDIMVTANGNTLTIKHGDETLASTNKINGAPITNITTDENGNVTRVTCTDSKGNVYVYAIVATKADDDSNSYKIDYQQVTSVEKPAEVNKDGVEAAKKELGKGENGKENHEFIAIVLPDGTYLKVGQGTNGDDKWLVNGTATDVSVTASGNTITISYKANGKTHNVPYEFPDLAGYNITNIVYSPMDSDNGNHMYDNLILYIAGIVVEDEYGNVQTLTLTAKDKEGEGSLVIVPPETEDRTGNATVGGTEKQDKEEIKYVSLKDLTGSAVVVVKTEGGEEIEMTYSEYLEAKANGDEDLTLVGVLESTITPVEEEDPVVDPVDPGEDDPTDDDPVIPVIPDLPPVTPVTPDAEVEEPEVPLADEPETEVEEPEVPLAEEPEVEVEEPEVPLADEPETVEIDEDDVPMSDVPKTGDNSYIWSVIALVSGMGLAWMTWDEKRKNTAK